MAIVPAPVCNPNNMEQEFLFLHILTTLVVNCFLSHIHFDWGKMKSQNCFNLHFPSCINLDNLSMVGGILELREIY